MYNRSLVGSLKEYTFDITDFDPKELAATHALKYKIDYQVPVCSGVQEPEEAYLCLDPRAFSKTVPENCKRTLRGVCHNERFVVGIERFYVRPELAEKLSQKLINRRVSIAVAVTPNGLGQVKDLLIDGIPWQNAP